MLLLTSLMAASSDGSFTRQNGDLVRCEQEKLRTGDDTYIKTIRENFEFNPLEHCQCLDFCETKCLVALGEPDHVLHDGL